MPRRTCKTHTLCIIVASCTIQRPANVADAMCTTIYTSTTRGTRWSGNTILHSRVANSTNTIGILETCIVDLGMKTHSADWTMIIETLSVGSTCVARFPTLACCVNTVT